MIEQDSGWCSDIMVDLGLTMSDLSASLKDSPYFADTLYMDLNGFREVMPELVDALGK
jgi:hypothetical protein